jgi:hypothetical protein
MVKPLKSLGWKRRKAASMIVQPRTSSIASTGTSLAPPGKGGVEHGPDIWKCACGSSVEWNREREKSVVPNGWVQMTFWLGGGSEYGTTRMEEKILCPRCAAIYIAEMKKGG